MQLISTKETSEFNLHFNLNNGMSVMPPDRINASSLLIGFQTPDGKVMKYYNFKHGWVVSIVVHKKCYDMVCLTGPGAHRLFQEVAAKSMWLASIKGVMANDHAAQLVDMFGIFKEVK